MHTDEALNMESPVCVASELRSLCLLSQFQLIVVDPPWSFKNFSSKGWKKGAQNHYECRDLEWIKSLPIREMADPSGCLLWLWATNPMLPQAIETVAAWGFKFKTAGAWVKRTRHGKLAFGTGYMLRSAHEPFLLATIGKVSTTRSTRSVIEAVAREHSRKPAEAYAAAEALVPWAEKRADIFSREKRAGWVSWGDQVERFNGAE